MNDSTNILKTQRLVPPLEKAWEALSDTIKSEYGEEVYEWQKEVLLHPQFDNPPLLDPQLVVDDIILALTSTHPRQEYYSGYPLSFKVLLLFLPRFIADRIAYKVSEVCGDYCANRI